MNHATNHLSPTVVVKMIQDVVTFIFILLLHFNVHTRVVKLKCYDKNWYVIKTAIAFADFRPALERIESAQK